MVESDFDFDGFLATDLSDTAFFDQSCDFVERVFLSNAVSMPFQWKLDFLLSFEKRHQMMSRLSSDPSQSSDQKRSSNFLSPLATKLGSFLSVFRGCDFPSALTEAIITDLDSSPHKFVKRVNSAYFLNHTSINPKHRHSFFPMDLMFERVLRDDADDFFREWPDVSICTPRTFLSTPCVGLHSILHRSPTLHLEQQTLLHLMNMLTDDIFSQDTTHTDLVHLFNYFPPPRLLDTLLSHPLLFGTQAHMRILFLIVFNSIGAFTAPFGACSSLAQVFKLLAPFDSNWRQDELNSFREAGEMVVSLHWLNIPAHFDSPLISHLPSLAGAQRSVLQTLSFDSGIPSLVTNIPAELNTNNLRRMLSGNHPHSNEIHLLALTVHYLDPDAFHSPGFVPKVYNSSAVSLLFPTPAVVSAAFEFFHRFVSVSSDAVRIELVKQGLLDRIVFAVSRSSFLDDYEKGIAVIGILLVAIRRVEQKRRMREFDFFRVVLVTLDALSNYECLEVPPSIQSIVVEMIPSNISHFIESGDYETPLAHQILRCHRLCEMIPPKQCITNLEQLVKGLTELLETSYISLFDEVDHQKIVTSLRRSHAVLEATQSTECIVEFHTFRSFLVSGLRSSNLAIQLEYHNLFIDIGDILATIDDPRDSQYDSFRTTFSDGTFCEKMTLLHLWVRWLDIRSEGVHGQMMDKSDFDFDGFLATDLNITDIFDNACNFVRRFFISNAVSMPFQWRLDFLLSFEKRHQMMLRLSTDPSSPSNQKRYRNFLIPLAITLGSFLSVIRGCEFPPPLTEAIINHLDSSPHTSLHEVNEIYFLNHPSIATKHRHSFFPMDLMFERYLRSDPNTFFRVWFDMSYYTPDKFIFTPYVGLHSLLLRYPRLNLEILALTNLMSMLFISVSDQDTIPTEMNFLFGFFPSPLLLDTLLSSSHLVRVPLKSWIRFFAIFCNYCAFSAPFGACSSLAQVFKMLAPFDSNPEQYELDVLRRAGDRVVSLHWLNIPSHFDSPLLCHLHSLAGAQRGVLQTLSFDFGIPSLVTPNTPESDWNRIRTMMSEDIPHIVKIHLLSLGVRSIDSDDFLNPVTITPFFIKFLIESLLSPIPALISAAFEFFHRFVSVSSDADRIELVKEEERNVTWKPANRKSQITLRMSAPIVISKRREWKRT
ncbi:hypothetical protein BLNAU_20078 [Blattamonas nauphoetae]|uniref:Uncharacterized protein n=1 Tax=Blattamonas nauphoetae TaxID=2049346 RepID=A0ABQ9WZN9_9EUKA|nr:hypothetical protein BLNAU_20078 [Blattamonas nauphoetae]